MAAKKVSVPGKGSLRWMADTERQETTVAKVEEYENSYGITRADGWHIGLDKEYGVVPKEGDPIIFFGRGIGSPVRGIVIAGKLAFYRTEEEQREYAVEQQWGKDAAEWLERWDTGKGVWTIRMGGMSPGYDQCINIMVAENVRELIGLAGEGFEVEPGATEIDPEAVKELDKRTDAAASKLGLTGAQYGVSRSLGVQLWLYGPVAVSRMYDTDRHTQASKNWPRLHLSDDDLTRAADALEDSARGDDDLRIAARLREIVKTGG